jgi:omega-hydroxy-beta-dihydromenaquinone-9 sulfotransferase
MKPASRKKDWSPPLWAGCSASAWARLLAANRFAVHRSRWHVAALASAASVFNSALGLAQRIVHGRRIAGTPITNAPVFILGHWRAGTTLLHELLGRDPRHAFPTTYECFAPHHFLLTRPWLPRLLARPAPTRPMDRMAAGYDRPQEDEFAMCLLGQPSPYRRIAFPNRPDAGALDLRGLSPRALRRWKSTLYRFVQALTLSHGGRRLILKSPPHACRIGTLLELFPDARFVHVVRDPYEVYPSTLHLWRVLYALWGLQRPAWEGLPEQILDTFAEMYDRLEEGKRLIPPGRFFELRYEDLVRDPVARTEAIYRALELGDFEPARPGVEAHADEVKDHEVNRYVLTPDERLAVTLRWGEVIRRYGYAPRWPREPEA